MVILYPIWLDRDLNIIRPLFVVCDLVFTKSDDPSIFLVFIRYKFEEKKQRNLSKDLFRSSAKFNGLS